MSRFCHGRLIRSAPKPEFRNSDRKWSGPGRNRAAAIEGCQTIDGQTPPDLQNTRRSQLRGVTVAGARSTIRRARGECCNHRGALADRAADRGAGTTGITPESYGEELVAKLDQDLTARFGRGFRSG